MVLPSGEATSAQVLSRLGCFPGAIIPTHEQAV